MSGSQVVHLDIKPENILLGEDDNLKLCDFGIAVVISNSQGHVLENLAGTTSYMAPEQFSGDQCTGATDQYALGIVVYEWLCGEVPFKSTVKHPGIQHIHATVPSLHEKNSSVSRDVEKVVLRALEKNPEQRFKSVQEFANAFEKASAPSTVGSRKPQVFYYERTEANPVMQEKSLSSNQSIGQPQQAVANTPSRKHTHKGKRSIPRRRVLELVTGAFILGTLVELIPKAAQIITLPNLVPTRTLPHSTPSPSITQTSKHTPTHPPNPIGTPDVNLSYVFYGHTGPVTRLAWSGDKSNPHIASASKDGTVQIWMPNGDKRQLYRIGSPIKDIAWGQHFGLVAFCTSKDVHVSFWNTLSSSYTFSPQTSKSNINALTWIHDPSYIQDIVFITDVGDIALYNHDPQKNWKRLNTLTYAKPSASKLLTVASSFDGKYIATGSASGTVLVGYAASNNPYLTSQHQDAVNSVVWSPDGTMIASGSKDKTVHIWNINSNNIITTYSLHKDQVMQVAWSPDGKYIASASADNTVQIWEASTGRHLVTYGKHTDTVNTVSWSPDGLTLASGGNDNTVQLWTSGLY